MTRCPVQHRHGVLTVIDDALGEAVLLDPGAWSPAGSMQAHRRVGPRALRVLATAGFSLPPALANNDTPSHRTVRGAVAPLVSARRVRASRACIESTAREAALEARESARREGQVDLAVVGPGTVPLRVMRQLLGVGDGLPDALLSRTAAPALELFWGQPDDDRQVELASDCAELYGAIRAELRRVRASGSAADGLLERLVAAGCEDEVVASAAFFTLVAGHETTRWLISGILARAAADPLAWRRLASEPQAVTEEALATASSVPRWRRTAVGRRALGPWVVEDGQTVAVELTGVGRAGSYAFGTGPHRCLGAELARLETEEVVSAIARALPDVRLVSTGPAVSWVSFSAPGAVRVALGEPAGE